MRRGLREGGRIDPRAGLMRRLLLGTAVLLAACGQNTPSSETKLAANEVPAMNEAQATPTAPASTSSLPPASAALRFVGRWATSQANCASKPWLFTADRLTATDGPHCSIYKVTNMAGGYDLAAECPAKVPDHSDLIKLRFAESAQAMLVESNAIAPMGLVYCGK
jgi:hypothetical protein